MKFKFDPKHENSCSNDHYKEVERRIASREDASIKGEKFPAGRDFKRDKITDRLGIPRAIEYADCDEPRAGDTLKLMNAL